MGNLAVLDVAPRFEHLEPAQALFIDGRLGNGILHRPFNTGVGGPDQFDHLVGVFAQGMAPVLRVDQAIVSRESSRAIACFAEPIAEGANFYGSDSSAELPEGWCTQCSIPHLDDLQRAVHEVGDLQVTVSELTPVSEPLYAVV